MRDVAIIGVGITKFGELWNKSFRGALPEPEKETPIWSILLAVLQAVCMTATAKLTPYL